jgi:antitoxin (DNA-binding transcriptional repressor) of toxin-antitoxin stability system
MITEISAADFESLFPGILGRVKRGELFSITVNGMPVADIAPVAP